MTCAPWGSEPQTFGARDVGSESRGEERQVYDQASVEPQAPIPNSFASTSNHTQDAPTTFLPPETSLVSPFPTDPHHAAQIPYEDIPMSPNTASIWMALIQYTEPEPIRGEEQAIRRKDAGRRYSGPGYGMLGTGISLSSTPLVSRKIRTEIDADPPQSADEILTMEYGEYAPSPIAAANDPT